MATFAATLASARPPLLNPQPVEWGVDRSRQSYPELEIADCPELDTRVMYVRGGFFPRGLRGVVAIYPGSGMRVSSDWGMKQSLAPIANQLRKMGYAVFAFQPPIYAHAEDAVRRRPVLEQYSGLEANLAWYAKTIHFILDVMGEERIDPAKYPLSVYARSTFATLSLEALHRYYQGAPSMAFFDRVRSVIAAGTYGHRPEEIEDCERKEAVFFTQEKIAPNVDWDVARAAYKMFRAMAFQTRDVPAARMPKHRPQVFAPVGARDEFAGGQLSILLSPLVEFSDRHPGAPVTIVLHDGGHNPASEMRGTDGSVLVPTMARMKAVLDLAYEQKHFHPTAEQPFRVVHVPDRSVTDSLIAVGDVDRCQLMLAAGEHVKYASRWRGNRFRRRDLPTWPYTGFMFE